MNQKQIVELLRDIADYVEVGRYKVDNVKIDSQAEIKELYHNKLGQKEKLEGPTKHELSVVFRVVELGFDL